MSGLPYQVIIQYIHSVIRLGNRETINTTRIISIILVVSCLLLIASCSTETKQVFFDIQPPTAKELAEQELKRQTALIEAQTQGLKKGQSGNFSAGYFQQPVDTGPRPEIESI
ncbi:MAG: hypothetical protein AB2735_00610, partial [Candidatus Thiodiazotropha taylori]